MDWLRSHLKDDKKFYWRINLKTLSRIPVYKWILWNLKKMEDWRYFETDLGKDNEVGEKFLVFLIFFEKSYQKESL